jgi:membrane-bound lytic murein transglycosylase B
MGHRGPKFLVYPNFEVILDWNRSQSYALAVGHLADRIAGGGPLAAELPEVETPLSRAHIERLQRRLAQLGFDPGPVDGLVGPGTRAALRSWQSSVGRIADGYPDPSTLAALAETEADSER